MAADLAAFGRKVAAAQGYNPRDLTVDWDRYGHIAQYQIGKGRGVPDPDKFRKPGTPAPKPAPVSSAQAHTLVPAGFAPAPIHSTRTVRLGGYEISRREAPLEPNRPHRLGRCGELATGHYRRRVRRSRRA